MTYQHAGLADGKWGQLSFVEQMANVGSEVERALSWKERNNADYSAKACERALELLDLTLDNVRNLPKLKETARVREALVDYFYGANQFDSSGKSWRKYFLEFVYAARKDH